MKKQPNDQKMTTKINRKVLIGIGVGVVALAMFSSLKTNHPDPVQQVKTEIVAPVVTPKMKKELDKLGAEIEAEAAATLAAEDQNPVKRQLPYECLSGGLSEYERDMMCGLQNDRSDQFVQNHREAFLQDENGNYINK